MQTKKIKLRYILRVKFFWKQKKYFQFSFLHGHERKQDLIQKRHGNDRMETTMIRKGYKYNKPVQSKGPLEININLFFIPTKLILHVLVVAVAMEAREAIFMNDLNSFSTHCF